MKKRLRKKRHIDEFAEWGRHLVVFRNTKNAADVFHDAFISEAIERNGCLCGGGLSDDKIDVIVELGKMADDPEGKFIKVTEWLNNRPDVEKWKAGSFIDLWNGNFDELED